MNLINEVKKEKSKQNLVQTSVEIQPSPDSMMVHEHMDNFNDLNTYGILPYYTFVDRTKEVLEYQKKLHRMFMAKKYPLLKPFAILHNRLNKILFGSEKFTIEELFAMEFASIKSLNSDLERMLLNCEKYTEEMCNFTTAVYSEAVKSNENKGDLKKEIGQKIKEYNDLKNQFYKIQDPLNKKALELDRKLEKIEGEKDHLYLRYILAVDTISDDIDDIKMAKNLRGIFTVNYFVYQRMCNRIKRIERRLSKFIGPYIMMIGVQEIGNEVYNQVTAVTNFSRELHNFASMGVSDAIRKLRSSITKMYNLPIQDSAYALNQIKTENAILNLQLEEKLKMDINQLRGR